MISFIAAVYNEEKEILDLVKHVAPLVDGYYIVDDGSTDNTFKLLDVDGGTSPLVRLPWEKRWLVKTIPHTGLPETVKNEALQMVLNDFYPTEWVVMLDADERFVTPISEIAEWIKSPASEEYDYVYFDQHEIIDGQHVRTFQKCKVFRKKSIEFPLNNIHADDRFTGRGGYFGWVVAHRKGSYKQVQRETEYLTTYKKLLEEGKIDEGRYQWLVNLHHYVKPHG